MPAGLKGFIPTQVSLRGKNLEISWIDASDINLTEPFFEQTHRRLISEGKRARIVTDLKAVFELSEQLPSCQPDGFIFHTSRCGSTLVCNALKSLPLTAVVAEAQPISASLVPYVPERIQSFAPETWEISRDRLVSAMITVFGQIRASAAARLYIKLNSWNTLALHIIRSLWPNVKWVFLYRDPIEILVSNVRNKPSWLEQRTSSRRASAFFGFTPKEVEAMSVEEFGARVLGKYFSNAADMANDHGLLMNYRQLNANGLRQILTFLGVSRDELEGSKIEEVLGFYSKDKDRLKPFTNDSDEKQSSASVALRRAVDEWSAGAFECLDAIAAAQHQSAHSLVR